MALACQKDSYLQILTANVKTCNKATNEILVDGKKVKIDGYEVVLTDTVLFPEGGGQPSDQGTLNGIPVLKVSRKGAEAVQFVEKELKVGEEVAIQIDWERRWDHMQQHSGQHLISALATSLFGYDTTAWNLGERISFVELDTPEMSAEQVNKLEKVANEKIRESVAMYCRVIEDKESQEVDEIRCRGLPDDHEGPIRVITIEGVDVNLCCGTHVSNLSHLQAIKLLGVEKGKKGKVNLTFLVGERILNYVSTLYEKEKVFTSLLKGHPDDHVSLLQKVQNSLKIAQKNSLTLLREVATFEATRLKTMITKPQYFFLHKKEGDNEFMNIISNEVGEEIFLFLTTGDEKGSGLFLVSGKPEDVKQLGPMVAELLEGRGAGKGCKYQGKAGSLSKRGDAERLISGHFSDKKSP